MIDYISCTQHPKFIGFTRKDWREHAREAHGKRGHGKSSEYALAQDPDVIGSKGFIKIYDLVE